MALPELLKPGADPDWDEDFAAEISEYHPYFGNVREIHAIATDNPYIGIFRYRDSIYAYYSEMEGIYYLGKNEEEVERNYEVIRLRGWDYSVFPMIDEKGQILKDAWCMGNWDPNWELTGIAERFEEVRMRELIQSLETTLEKENRKKLEPLEIMDLVALHTWIDRESPKFEEVERNPFYSKVAKRL